MLDKAQSNYSLIARSIQYAEKNYSAEEPTLNQVAQSIQLGLSEFEKLYRDWAGIDPKLFFKYLNAEFSRQLSDRKRPSSFSSAPLTGILGPGQKKNPQFTILKMTPEEAANGGRTLVVSYCFTESPFGKTLLGSTRKGLCYMAFFDDEDNALLDLKNEFPKAQFIEEMNGTHQEASAFFRNTPAAIKPIVLHLKGTEFQVEVWETLLQIPSGCLTTYGAIAKSIDKPKASRAVGAAIGSNVIAHLVPCHRVIPSSGIIGNYKWSSPRKTAIICWEAAGVSLKE